MSRLLAVLATALLAPVAFAAGPAFDGKAAMAHVERLVGFGPRPSGSPALARARAYIVQELKGAGARVSEQPFTVQTPDGAIRMVNVVGELPGRVPDVIVLGGHYDTKFFSTFAFLGANDGGSSSGLLLELARALGKRRREFTYWIVLFDGEEARREWSPTDGIYGSRHFVQSLVRDGRLTRVRAVVVVDMIGDRELDIRREAASTAWLTDVLWGSARRLGHQSQFLDEVLAVEDDHVPFLKAGIPSALVIDFDYGSYWHTPQDTLDKLSPTSLQIVGDVLLDALPAMEALLRRGAGREGPR